MSRRRKRLEAIRRNPKNVTFEALRAVLEDYGFFITRSKGSHFFFVALHKGRDWNLVIPHRKPYVHVAYVKQALDAIVEVTAFLETDDD